MGRPPDPDWYLDHVLVYADPDQREAIPRGRAGRWQWWWQRRALDLSAEPFGPVAARQGFVLTTAQLRGFAVERHDVRREIRRGRWSAPARGVVAPLSTGSPGTPGSTGSTYAARRRRHALDATAAVLTRPGAVVSGRSAAVLHGLPVLAVPTHPEVTEEFTATLGERGRSHVYGARLYGPDITGWFGASVTSIARTIVDLARHDRRDGLLAADAALHEDLVRPADLARVLVSARGWPGVRAARSMLALASETAESRWRAWSGWRCPRPVSRRRSSRSRSAATASTSYGATSA